MKRAQTFTIDFFMSLLIFSFAIATFLVFQPEQSEFNSLLEEADTISEDLLSEGIPNQWNVSNVIDMAN